MKLYIPIYLLLSFTVFADIDSAKKNFQSHEYKKAYNEFQLLSKIGINEAQHYLAKMLTNNDKGVNQDLILAYAWSSLSELDANDYSKMTAEIGNKLSESELVKAKNLAVSYKKTYSYDRVQYTIKNNNNNFTSFKLNPEASIIAAPKYPTKMAFRGQEGYVALSFSIYPDGSVRDIVVVDEFPNGAFTEEAIIAISKYNLAYKIDNKNIKLEKPMPGAQLIEFKMNNNTELSYNYIEKIREIKRKALNGDIYAGLQYYKYFTYILKEKDSITHEQINKWLIRASKFGYIEANYLLGMKMFYGINIVKQRNIAVHKLVAAATYGHKKAQYLLYQLISRNELQSKFEGDALYWLENAIKNDSINAKLEFVKYISKLSIRDKKQIKKAKKYLKEYAKRVAKTPDWYQAKALLEAKNKQYIKASQSINNAIRIARESHWDLTELKKQRALIKQHKQIFE